MKLSGTNSVKPPVRACTARTTRMCSASSHGSSMWPNITVTVERRPARCDASMICTQRATGSLFGLMRWRTPSCRTSAAVPGVESRPAARSRANTASGAKAADVAHVRDLHRRVRVQVQLRRDLLREAQPALVVLDAPVGMDPRLHAQLARAERDGLANPRDELLAPELVRVGRALALTEAAERAADDADVRDVDVAVDDERHRVPRELGAQLVGGLAHVLDRLRARLGEQRGQLVGLQRRAVARAHDRRRARGRAAAAAAARCGRSRGAG